MSLQMADLLFLMIGLFVFSFYLVLTAGISFLIPTISRFSALKFLKRDKLTREQQRVYGDTLFSVGYVVLLLSGGLGGLIFSYILYIEWKSHITPTLAGAIWLTPFVAIVAVAAYLQLYAVDLRRNRYNANMHLGMAILLGSTATFFSAITANW